MKHRSQSAFIVTVGLALAAVSAMSAATGQAAPARATPHWRTIAQLGTALKGDVGYDFPEAQGMSCPTVKRCEVVRLDHVYRTTDGGRHWADTKLTPKTGGGADTPSLDAVTCQSGAPKRCIAGGYDDNLNTWLVYTTDGRHWRSATVHRNTSSFPGAGTINDITCPTASECIAATGIPGDGGSVGGRILRSANGGRSWRQVYVNNRGIWPTAASCPTAKTCYVTGQQTGLLVSTTGGRTWHKRSAPNSGLQNLACYSNGACLGYADRSTAYRTIDGGKHWRTSSLHHTPQDEWFSSLTCVPGKHPSLCVLVSNRIFTTTTLGRTWSSVAAPSPVRDLASVSCPEEERCFASGATKQGRGAVVAAN